MSGIKSIDDKLSLSIFHIAKESHIKIDKAICKGCPKRSCLTICPVENYKWDEDKDALIFNYEGCLECGACKLVCPLKAINWSYPGRGCGVVFKNG